MSIMSKECSLSSVVMGDVVKKSRASGKVACLFESLGFVGEFVGLTLESVVPSKNKKQINPDGSILEHVGIFGETLPADKFILIVTSKQFASITVRGLYTIYIRLN